MAKSYLQSAEESSAFPNPAPHEGDKDKKGEREDTAPLREARFIDIERIKPDPNQPRKIFDENALESLAESIKELGEIIDPLTVEYDDQEDFFRIISGERRYRAAKLVGMERLPCILKDVDEKKRLLFQLVANLQREEITPLEESAGIRTLIEKFNYSQVQTAKVLNKSKSYVSQILGLERLTPPAKEIVQTSELSKEILIQASKEKGPQKQLDFLNKASEGGKTVRQIRKEKNGTESDIKKQIPTSNNQRFQEWIWSPKDGRFIITIRFSHEQKGENKIKLVRDSLEKTLLHLK